jgi:hypothetical protein
MAGQPIVCADPQLIFWLIPAWTATWALVGYLVGASRRPKRFILVEESGTWTHAKLHHVESRGDDAPTGLEESPPPERSTQG